MHTLSLRPGPCAIKTKGGVPSPSGGHRGSSPVAFAETEPGLRGTILFEKNEDSPPVCFSPKNYFPSPTVTPGRKPGLGV